MSNLSRDYNHNPLGLGGLKFRRHHRFVLGAPGNCCDARCKQKPGEFCRQPPVRGSKRCRFHGGFAGRGRVRLAKNERVAHSKAMALVRKASRAELERVELHPETHRACGRYTDIYPPNLEILLLGVDQHLRGEIDRRQFQTILEMARERAEIPCRKSRKTRNPALVIRAFSSRSSSRFCHEQDVTRSRCSRRASNLSR